MNAPDRFVQILVVNLARISAFVLNFISPYLLINHQEI